MFGGSNRVLPVLELDRFFVRPLGQLGVYGTLGYTSMSAHAFAIVGGHVSDTRAKADVTTLRVLPLSLGVVYTKGNGDLSQVEGKGKADGGTLGVQGTLGISMRADFIDPDSTRNLEDEMGVEHVGFFFEGTLASVSGLGMANKLHLGDLTWSAGVNFEF